MTTIVRFYFEALRAEQNAEQNPTEQNPTLQTDTVLVRDNAQFCRIFSLCLKCSHKEGAR